MSSIHEPIGILFVNSGTPDTPSEAAVRAYLKEFLSDKQVVQLPRFLWLPILYGIILPLRPKRTAKLYQKIWTPKGMPMRVYMQELAHRIQSHLTTLGEASVSEIGMNYGAPSLERAFQQFRQRAIKDILVLPLYPQYSTTTTQSVIKRIEKIIASHPEYDFNLMTVSSYATHPAYIDALADQVLTYWQKQAPAKHLLMSFHGIPQRYVQSGDPYQDQCEQTASLLAGKLNLQAHEWTLCYQSRFGYNRWLKPALPEVLTHLLKQDVRHVDVICPGFPVDCLETLEEIAIRAKEDFIAQGGEMFNYIPALNAEDKHLNSLAEIIKPYLNKAARPLQADEQASNNIIFASSS